MDIGIEEIVAIGSVIIAVVSLIANSFVVDRQMKLQTEGLKIQMEEDVIAWAQEAIGVLSEGVALVTARGEFYAADEIRRSAHEIGHRLSGLADRGRLFFPNELVDDFGAMKAAAFRGVRPPILDAIVFSSCAMLSVDADATDADVQAREILLGARRLVVSEAQNAIDPRRREKILDTLREGRKDDLKPREDAVSELHAALASRMPDAHVVKEWARSRAEAKMRASPG